MISEMETQPTDKVTEYRPTQSSRYLWLWFAVPTLAMIGCWTFLTVNVPYWDDYSALLQYLVKCPKGLFDFHNEHRIVFTRLIANAILYLNYGVFNFRAMMAVGNLIQFAYAVGWVLVFRKSKFGLWASVPVFWLLTSFIHYENSCWALTSVQNVAVVAFTFAAILSFYRWQKKRWMPFCALACATIATYTSGGGMLVWPCMIAAGIAEPFNGTENWRNGFKNFRDAFCCKLPRLLVLAVAAAAAIGCYFIGFPGSTAAPGSTVLLPGLVNGILFLLAFLGGVVPVYQAALILGALSLAALVYFALHYPQIRRPEIFWFIVAEFGTMCSAALFRSTDPHTAVSSRYCIVSCSVFAGMWYLALEQIPLPDALTRRAVRWVMWCVAIYTTAFLALGAPRFAKRNEILRRNILTWKTSNDGLRSPEPERAGQILVYCWKYNIYNPDALLKPDETPPDKPEPWLR